MPLKPDIIASREKLRTGDGRAVPPRLRDELVREHERLCLVHKQIVALEAKSRAELRAPAPGLGSGQDHVPHRAQEHQSGWRAGVVQRGVLIARSTIAASSAAISASQHALDSGVEPPRTGHLAKPETDVPAGWRSSSPGCGCGISLAAHFSRWFNERVAGLEGHIRRITIVAMACKPMVALWHYLINGVVPTGAVLRSVSPQRPRAK